MGSMALAFNFESGTNVCTEASYPYKAADGSCKSPCTTAIAQGGITGYKSVGNFLFGASVSDMQSALNSNPVSIAIEADQSAFQHYSGGIWGDAGYLKISNVGNPCGVLNQPVYPTVSASVAV